VNDQWLDALVAAACMAVAPQAIKGIQIRASSGPLRDYWLSYYAQLVRSPIHKIPCTIDDERLIGGIDIAASLTLGKPIKQTGLLHSASGHTLILAMAERLQHRSSALVAQALDVEDIAVIAFDESAHEDESLAICLDEKLPLILTLGSVSLQDFESIALSSTSNSEANELPIAAVDLARQNYLHVACDQECVTAICSAAIALGVDSMRAPIAAITLAKIHAALQARNAVEEDDLSFAVRVVIAPRATRAPAEQQSEEQPKEVQDEAQKDMREPEQDPASTDTNDQQENAEQTPPLTTEENVSQLQELILQAALASIPRDLLASLQTGGKIAKAKNSGSSGAIQRGGQRGRSAGVFRKKPDAQAKIHLLHTLRASIAWQKMRKQQAHNRGELSSTHKIIIRKDDFRYLKKEQKTKSIASLGGSQGGHRTVASPMLCAPRSSRGNRFSR
jgi:magnesium chelatase subunit D